MSRIARLVALLLFVAFPAAAQFTGTWTGQFEERWLCSTGDFTATGPLTLVLTQTGNNVTGTGTTVNSFDECLPIPPEQDTAPIAGTVSGNTLKGFVGTGEDAGPFTATVSGSTMSFSIDPDPEVPEYFWRATLTKSTTSTLPTILSFVATPATIVIGSSATLSWVTQNATGVSIDNGVGGQPLSGTPIVAPTATTTYTLTATNSAGAATKTTTLTVTAPPSPPANVIVSAFPRGMLQSTGTSSSDSYALTNIGGTATTVTLTRSQNFFDQTPASFSLPAGGTQLVFITAAPQAAGRYEATSNIAGTGVTSGSNVPIRLLAAAAPAAPVAVTPVATRSDFVAPAGENPENTIVMFKNDGASTIDGLITADVPWITIQNSVFTLAAGETRPVPFTINRALRPDAAAPVGGAAATLSFSYVNASAAAGAGKPAGDATTPVLTTVPVTIVDVVSLQTSSSFVPPIPAGQIALYIPGASSQSFAIGDLVLSNRSASTIADLKMYFSGDGGNTGLSASVGQFLSNSSISFPGVVKNIFRFSSHSGTLHFRGAQLTDIALIQQQINAKFGKSYGTALPLFRSDRGPLPGESLYLPGVQKTAQLSTNLHLQEVSGTQANVTIESFDAEGLNVGRRETTLLPFHSIDLIDEVPAGGAIVRVTNTSGPGGPGRINAYALVIDSATNDAVSIVQIEPVTDPMFLPAFGNEASPRQMYLNLSNASNVPITITATTIAGPSRRRTSAHSIASSAVPQQVTIPPLGFRRLQISEQGFVKLTGSTALRVGGTFAVAATAGALGSGVGAVPKMHSLTLDQTRRFAGIDDASAATRAAGRQLTYRTNVILAETIGQPAKVKLTLRYVFPTGRVSTDSVSSSTFDVPPGGLILISGLAGSVIGPARATFGDLRNMILDVQVIGGNGSVLPFLQVIDNGTGDVTVRHE